MSRVSVDNSSVTVLLEIDGVVHLVAMEQEHRETVDLLVKMTATTAYATKRSQKELNEFLGYKG